MQGVKHLEGCLSFQAGMEMVRGEIIDKDEESITVKLPDGSSKIVLVSGETEINKAEKATVDDLYLGLTVMALGTSNSDESVLASQIQLNFEMMGRGQP